MMTTDMRRITLVSRADCSPNRSWDTTLDAPNRVIFLRLAVLHDALGRGVAELEEDVERVILDHSATAVDFLELLTNLPPEFTGDALLIRDDDTGFLSSTGRGGDRVLYALSACDTDFYLDTHGLLAPAEMLALKSA